MEGMIPSLDKPGYPKPASLESVADYGGVKFIKDYVVKVDELREIRIEAGTFGTATRLYLKCCNVWITGGPTVNNVPYEFLEATN